MGKIPVVSRPKLHCVAFANNCQEIIGAPDIVNDVRDVAAIKINALKAHCSQTQLTADTLEKKLKENDPEMISRLLLERFWTYKFI